MLNKKSNSNRSLNETATIFWHHIHLLIFTLNDYIDDIQKCVLNPQFRLNNNFHLDKLKQYHEMTCEMINIINDEEKNYIKITMEDEDFLEMFRGEMRNKLVINKINQYLYVYKGMM